MSEIIAIGEGMLEVSRGSAERATWNLGCGGDTLNVAVYLARLGTDVAYMTAVGDDNLSHKMRAEWALEGVDTGLVLTNPDRLPGLYLVETDDLGERTFHYWRDQSAARTLFQCAGVEAALARIGQANAIYLSGITLSIFRGDDRTKLVDLCATVRASGGVVAFDPNYRSRGWPSAQEAQGAVAQIAPYVTIALPTLADDVLLYGPTTVEDCRKRWKNWGAREVAIKLGSDGVAIASEGIASIVAAEVNLSPRDTTGAGDSFNAAYLSARFRGFDQHAAAKAGNTLAAEVVRHPGAIIPRTAMPCLLSVCEADEIRSRKA